MGSKASDEDASSAFIPFVWSSSSEGESGDGFWRAVRELWRRDVALGLARCVAGDEVVGNGCIDGAASWDDARKRSHRDAYTNVRPMDRDERTLERPKPFSDDCSQTEVVALDCEMVGVGDGGLESMLAQVCVLNEHGNALYCSYSRAYKKVTDYRTHVSGILPRHVDSSAPEFAKVRADVAALIRVASSSATPSRTTSRRSNSTIRATTFAIPPYGVHCFVHRDSPGLENFAIWREILRAAFRAATPRTTPPRTPSPRSPCTESLEKIGRVRWRAQSSVDARPRRRVSARAYCVFHARRNRRSNPTHPHFGARMDVERGGSRGSHARAHSRSHARAFPSRPIVFTAVLFAFIVALASVRPFSTRATTRRDFAPRPNRSRRTSACFATSAAFFETSTGRACPRSRSRVRARSRW